MVAKRKSGLEEALEEVDDAKKEFGSLEQQLLDRAYGRVQYDQSYDAIEERLKIANERVMEAIFSLRKYLVQPPGE